MKSYAPARIAAIAVSRPPWPVSTIGSRSGCRWRSSWHSSMPDMPGHLDVGDDDVGGRRCAGARGTAWPEVTASTSKPRLRRLSRKQHRGVFVVVDDQDGSVHVEVLPFCRRVSPGDGTQVALRRGSAARDEADDRQDERDDEDDLRDARGARRDPEEAEEAAISAMTKNVIAQENIDSSYARCSVQRMPCRASLMTRWSSGSSLREAAETRARVAQARHPEDLRGRRARARFARPRGSARRA